MNPEIVIRPSTATPATITSTPNNFSSRALLNLDSHAQQDASKLPDYTYGTLPRNSFRDRAATNVDVALAKKFKIRERSTPNCAGTRSTCFNHTQFAIRTLTITDLTFGQISGTYAPRILQIALHLRF